MKRLPPLYRVLRTLGLRAASPMEGVETRPFVEEDIALARRHFEEPSACPSREDFVRQQEGTASAILAWAAGRPVGIGFIHWHRPRHPDLLSNWEGTPEIFRLYVNDRGRSRGVGTRLLRALEGRALQDGYRQVGLGVHVSNPRAKALYLRCGYTETDSTFDDHYDVATTKGGVSHVHQPTTFCVRILG